MRDQPAVSGSGGIHADSVTRSLGTALSVDRVRVHGQGWGRQGGGVGCAVLHVCRTRCARAVSSLACTCGVSTQGLQDAVPGIVRGAEIDGADPGLGADQPRQAHLITVASAGSGGTLHRSTIGHRSTRVSGAATRTIALSWFIRPSLITFHDISPYQLDISFTLQHTFELRIDTGARLNCLRSPTHSWGLV